MHLYIRHDLVKAVASPTKPSSSSSKKVSSKPIKPAGGAASTGEQRGGNYVARVQTGYEKDGSPKYKYFKSQDEYKAWKERRTKGGSKHKKQRGGANPHNLEQKTDREHRESTKKTGSAPKTKGSDPLKDNETAVKKALYVRF